jgi:hypothetical protein
MVAVMVPRINGTGNPVPHQFLCKKRKFDSNFGNQIQFLLTWTGTNGWPVVNPQALNSYILENIYPGLGSGSTHK